MQHRTHTLRVLSVCALLAALPSCVIDVDLGHLDGTRFSVGSGSGPRIHGNGIDVLDERNVDLGGVLGLVLLGAVDARVEVGATRTVTVRGDDNVVPHVHTIVEDDVLRIGLDDGSYEIDAPLEVTVGLPALEFLRLVGSSDVEVVGLGGGRLDVALIGSGDIALDGHLDELSVELRGSGDVSARDVDVRRLDVELRGSGDVAAGSVEDLRVRLSGSGDVSYRGTAARHDVSVRGSGDVHAR